MKGAAGYQLRLLDSGPCCIRATLAFAASIKSLGELPPVEELELGKLNFTPPDLSHPCPAHVFPHLLHALFPLSLGVAGGWYMRRWSHLRKISDSREFPVTGQFTSCCLWLVWGLFVLFGWHKAGLMDWRIQPRQWSPPIEKYIPSFLYLACSAKAERDERNAVAWRGLLFFCQDNLYNFQSYQDCSESYGPGSNESDESY